ncbi:N-terminal Xaa-Pro-Lys N-methyltransferase 1-like [Clavelina lepadiformis]|uniref:Alpha N-terminal protein methyltransferase 1 n=1 Tax=Clavelina lepadiformis TaxID=159417 RepID=A0ABP0GHC9_CLALP
MSLIDRCKEVQSEKDFYGKADEYWKSIPADVNGMLGGYGHISTVDIRTSKSFLKPFIQGASAKTKTGRALDCGAGIGRVTKHLLLPLFDIVDLVELNKAFLDEAKTYIGQNASRVGNYFCCGLQSLELPKEFYDVIWIQWVTGHLTDAHLIKFLQRCKEALRSGGIVVIKDNVAILDVEHDPQDSSVTRNSEDLQTIYKESGLRILKEEKVTRFPTELYNVIMTALAP